MENTTTNNLYPKRYMSIKELVPYGFTEHQLKQFLKIKGFPHIKRRERLLNGI